MGLFVLVSVFALFFQQSRGIPQDELEVLLDFKSKLHNATFLHGWQQSNAPCDWEGVTCDPSKQHIVALQLFGYGGTITPLLGRLEQLQELYLRFGSFQGTIPRELGNCTKLRVLDLSYNSLRGAIPPELGHCTSLQSLHLSYNSLGGAIPPELGHCTGLQSLDLSYNSLGGAIPPELGHCTGLQTLDLSDNSLGGAIPASLANLSLLQDLSLYRNELDCQVFPRLPHIKSIDLCCNTTFASVSSELGQFRTIELQVRGGTGAPPNWLAFWKGEDLQVYGQDVESGASISDDYAIPTNVTSLTLSGLNLEGEVPAALLSQLEKLDLSGNQLSSIQAARDGTPTTLESLDLGRNNLTLADLERLTRMKHANLTSLDMSFNRLAGEEVPYSIAASSPRLDYLSFSNNALVGNLSWATQFPNPSHSLDLSYNNLSGSIPHNILSRIQYLDLSHNKLTGHLPSDIPGIGGYTIIRLASNELEGSLPLRFPAGLAQLDLSSNRFSGSIPPALCELPDLYALSLAGNQLEGSIPDFDFLANLSILDLSGNRLSGQLPPNLALFGSRELSADFLDMTFGFNGGRRNFDGDSLVRFALISLDVSSNQLQGEIPAELGNSMLMELNLSSNKFTGSIPRELGNLMELEALDLSHNLLQGSVPQELCRPPLISLLNVSYNNLSGTVPSCNAMDTKYPGAFDGNAFLCGPFVNNSGCQHHQEQQPTTTTTSGCLRSLVSPWASYMGLVMGFYFTLLPMLFYRFFLNVATKFRVTGFKLRS